MQPFDDQDHVELAALMAMIAHSQIVVARPVKPASLPRLPAGFDEIDLAVLDWIAVEARRVGRSFLRM